LTTLAPKNYFMTPISVDLYFLWSARTLVD